jgi:hypothetical protein
MVDELREKQIRETQEKLKSLSSYLNRNITIGNLEVKSTKEIIKELAIDIIKTINELGD